MHGLNFAALLLVVFWAACCAWGGDESACGRLEVPPANKVCFSTGDVLGTIVPKQDGGCVVTVGQKQIDLDFAVKRVLTNVEFCVLVGEDKIAAVRVKPEVELMGVRAMPMERKDPNVFVSLDRGSIFGASPATGIVWQWGLSDGSGWCVKASRLAPVIYSMARTVYQYVVVLDQDQLITPDETKFRSLATFEGMFNNPVFIYTSKKSVTVFFLLQRMVVCEVDWTKDQRMFIKGVKHYRAVIPVDGTFRELRTGETLVCQTDVDGEAVLWEMDSDHGRYRCVKIDRSKKGYDRLFMHKGDFYSSTDYEQGVVVEGKVLEKEEWKALEALPADKEIRVKPAEPLPGQDPPTAVPEAIAK